MDFTVENAVLVFMGLIAIGCSPLTARLNALSFPFPSPRASYIASLISQIVTGILLIVLGLRGLILNCPPFPIEQMPDRCRW
ncbi:MAG: hypothetical protein ACP5ME_15255 [Anaerolineae bacterium]|jgi:hypothetical protein|uniref:hypothetical protein n=1 Tax=Thermogutta sp. TaxID=1962930 RepID=UPI00322062BF